MLEFGHPHSFYKRRIKRIELIGIRRLFKQLNHLMFLIGIRLLCIRRIMQRADVLVSQLEL